MARILALTSQVVRGHVGLAAIVPTLQRLGHEVWPMPTVLLSNHPGHRLSAGLRVEPRALAEMADTLAKNGWLGEVDAVLTGYLPSEEHVDLAVRLVGMIRRARPGALFVCDPIMGDDPKGLYIDARAAAAIRDRLVGLADLATPNRMELSYLTGRSVSGIDDAARALECLDCGGGIATSIPCGTGEISNVASLGPALAVTRVALRTHAAHGTGDLMAALLVGHLSAGTSLDQALGLATAGVDAVLGRSGEAGELALTEALPMLDGIAPWPVKSAGGRARLTMS